MSTKQLTLWSEDSLAYLIIVMHVKRRLVKTEPLF